MRGRPSIASAFFSLADAFSLRPVNSALFYLGFLSAILPYQIIAQAPEDQIPQYEWLKKADLPTLTVSELNTEDITIAIATDPQGNVYTLSFGDGVDKRNAEGVIIENGFIPAGELDSPLDIAIDENGFIYIADFLPEGASYEDNGKIKVFDPQGNPLPGRTILTSFYRPLGIDVDSDKVYVAEFNDGNSGPETTPLSRLRIYDKMSGNAINETDQVEVPYRIGVNSQGTIYVSQAGNDDPAVLIFDESLILQGELTNITSPGSIVVDHFDFVHVIEYNGRIDFTEFINFEDLGLGEILSISDQIYRGQGNEEFIIKIFSENKTLVGSLVQNLDFPLDIAFNYCDRMYVNNAEIFGSSVPIFGFVPSRMEFDLEIYQRTPFFDTEAPKITCPENFSVSLPPGQDSMIVIYDMATVIDNCSATVSRTGGPASGSEFTAGTYEIEFTATDGAGNTDFCTFAIVVEGEEGAAAFDNCPPDITATANSNSCGAIVSFSSPTASERSGALEVTRTGGLDSGSFFPVGSTTVTFEATASNGDILTCSFKVIVNDTQSPEISCGPNVEVTADPGKDSAIVEFLNPTVVDNCPVKLVQTGGISGSEFPIGVHTIQFTATDASGNTDTCTLQIIVRESSTPSFACPSEEGLPTLKLDENCEYQDTSFSYLLDSFENFVNQPFFEQTEERNGNLLLVTILVYDGEGGAFVKSCEFNIQLVDDLQPVIDCPGSQTISPNENGKYILPDYRGSASDNCDGNLNVVQTPPPGEITENTTVRIVATDEAGNTSDECTFNVILQQEETHRFTCPDLEDLPVLEIGLYCEIVVPDYDHLLSSFENFTRDPYFIQTEERVGNILNVEIEVFDGEGGESVGSCDFEISLIDTFPPQIDCPTAAINISPNSDGIYILPDFRSRVFDNCTANLEIAQNPPPGEITEGGTVSLTAIDASGNEAVGCEFEVVLLHEGEPNFSCPTESDIPDLPVDANCNYVLPDLNSLLSNFKNFKDSPLFENSIEQTGDILQIQIKVYDGFQEEEFLVGECNFTIDLIDTTPPQATCVSGFTVQLDENGTATITAEDLDNGSSDGCGIVNRSISQTTFTTTDLDSSPMKVTLTVSDAAGNSDSCTTQVTVEPYNPDELDPFSCITSLTLPLNGIGEADLNIEQLYVGTLGPDGSISIDRYFFTCADIGEQIVNLTYSGTSTGTCPITITVVDNTPPAPRPKNIEISLNENGTASITAADLEAGSTDNCSLFGLQFRINKTTFTCEDVGENILDFTVRDANTNSTTTNVTVTVNDPHSVCGGNPVEPPEEGRFVILFPNPSRGQLQFATSPGLELHRVEIFDMRGRFMDARELTINPHTQSYSLDLQMFQTGVYTLKVYSNVREYIRRAIITTF